VLQEVDGTGKGSLLTFLHGAGLLGTETPTVALTEGNLEGANLKRANLQGTNLEGANLREADLQGAIMPDGSKYP
jgi:2-iminobutanoate/2-iminopropanoate deaminase